MQNNKIIFTILLALVLIFGLTAIIYKSKKVAVIVPDTSRSTNITTPKNGSYNIEGGVVKLKDGFSEGAVAPGSASKITTKYFGNEVTHDFDGDGRLDSIFIVTQNTGGSGTFYYVVAALNKASGYVGSQAFLLGDRVAPQNIEMSKDPTRPHVVVINYTDRKAGESFDVAPSVGKSKWLALNPVSLRFGEVDQTFSGDVNPSQMTLNMKSWKWINTVSAGKTVTPKRTDKFILTFKNATDFGATTDCNGVGGNYSVKSKGIIFNKMLSTMMFCEDSQEQAFTKMLSDVQSYAFTGKGELVFTLKSGGVMTFK